MRTKREQILDAAMRLFVEKGIHATSTASIAKKAGVATGTLFHHFPTKDELVHALYHEIYGSLLAYKESRFDHEAAMTVREKLRQQWLLDIEWGTGHVEYMHFLERYSFMYYASETTINEIFDRFQHYLDIFHEAVALKLMKIEDPEYIREHFIWNMRMNIAYFIAYPDKCTPETIEKSFEIYWQGVSNAN